MMASRSRRAWTSANTRSPSLRRSSAPAGSRIEGPKRTLTASKPAVPGATVSRASTSASMVGTPSALNTARTWLLPVAIPPVSATRCMGPRCLGVSRSSEFRHRRFLRRGDAFLHECIPFMALGALPEQFSAPVAAVRADMGIEVEDRVARQADVAADELGVEPKLEQRPHDFLVHDQSVGIVRERREQQIERVLG